jgi:hypothetical protein
MKKSLTLLTLIALSLSAVCAQTWIKRLPMDGLPDWDVNRSKMCNVIAAIGGGYIAQGYKTNSTVDGWDWYDFNILWKLDENGNVLQRTIIDIEEVIVSMVSNGFDRYYCLVQSDSGSLTILIVLDTGLNLLETHYFETVNGYRITLYDMQYADDGLVFVGRIGSQALAIKTDFQFNVIWQSEILGREYPLSIEPYEDGWIAMSWGECFASISSIGDTLWTYHRATDNIGFHDCKVSSDSRVFLLGLYKLWEMDMIDHEPRLVAEDTPGGFDYHNYKVRSIDILPNGNIVYTGRADTGEILHCYSPDGVHQWSRAYNVNIWATYLGTGSKNLLVMPDGSILFLLHDRPGAYLYLIKTDAEGNVVANDDPITPAPVASITAFPQPASDRLTLAIKSELPGDLSYSIYNIKGQKLYTGDVGGHQREQRIDLDAKIVGNLPNGIYLVNLKQNNRTIASCKAVIVK